MRKIICGVAVLLMGAALFLPAGAHKAGADENYDALGILLSMKEGYNNIESYTAVLVKGEPAMSNTEAPQKIFVKFQKPFKVYMKWVEGPHDGRELLYVAGQNNDHFFVKPEGFIGFIVRLVKLPSTYRSDESKYTVRDFGLGNLIDGILNITLNAKEKNDLDLHCKGVVRRNGREVYAIERFLPEKEGYKNHRLVLYVDKQTSLPVEAYVYNAQGKLLEFCLYQDLNVNPPLGSDDFSVDNKKYGFRYL